MNITEPTAPGRIRTIETDTEAMQALASCESVWDLISWCESYEAALKAPKKRDVGGLIWLHLAIRTVIGGFVDDAYDRVGDNAESVAQIEHLRGVRREDDPFSVASRTE